MIKDKEVFNSIIKKGHFVKDSHFVIYNRPKREDFSHFGIAIKKSIGNAVTRNRLKRQVRALVDRNRKMFKKTEDYIIMIREGILNASFREMESAIQILMKGNADEKK